MQTGQINRGTDNSAVNPPNSGLVRLSATVAFKQSQTDVNAVKNPAYLSGQNDDSDSDSDSIHTGEGFQFRHNPNSTISLMDLGEDNETDNGYNGHGKLRIKRLFQHSRSAAMVLDALDVKGRKRRHTVQEASPLLSGRQRKVRVYACMYVCMYVCVERKVCV